MAWGMAWAERVCDAYKRGPGLHVPKKQKTKKKEDRERERERERAKHKRQKRRKSIHQMGKKKSPASNYYIFELRLLHKVLQQSKLLIWHNLQGLHIPTRKIKKNT